MLRASWNQATDVRYKGASAESEATLPTGRYYPSKAPLKKRLKKLRVNLYLHNSIPVDETFIKSPNGRPLDCKVTNLFLIFAIPGQLESGIKRACTIQANM